MMQSIVGGITGVLMTLAALLGISTPQNTHVAVQTPAVAEPTFGAFAPAGGLTYYLQSSIGLTNTTITLSSFQNRTGIPLTMALLNTDIGYATLDPQTTISEFISFTGITQNANGTATLTGVTRGLSDIYPFTASSTMRQPHSGQSRLILSDPPQLFNEYAARRNAEYVSGIWSFGALPVASTTCVTGTQFCNKDYIDAGLNQGAATSTFINLGIVELATDAETLAGTASSTFGGPLVIPNKYATSTPTASCTGLACIPVAISGKIAQAFLDLTQHFSFSSIFATSASTTNATTTNLTVTGNVVGITKKVGLQTSISSVTNATTTALSTTVAGGSLSTNNYIKAKVYIRGFRNDFNLCPYIAVEAGYGNSTTTMLINSPVANGDYSGAGFVDVLLSATGATNTQKMSILWQTSATTSPTYYITSTTTVAQMQSKTMAIDSTASQYFGIAFKLAASSAFCWLEPEQAIAELYR